MTDAKQIGRTIGVMLLVQLVGLMVGFMLITSPLQKDYLTTAAASAVWIKLGVMVLLANCSLTIGISVTAWRVFRDHSPTLGIWLILVSVIMLVMQAVDAAHIMSMVSLSENFTAGVGSPDAYNALGASVRSTRRWAHFLELFAIDAWIIIFEFILLRFALVPRVLAGAALLTAVVHFFAIPLPGFLGYGITTAFGVPMAVGLLAVSVWMMFRGIDARAPSGDGM